MQSLYEEILQVKEEEPVEGWPSLGEFLILVGFAIVTVVD